jgi:hypothetical protein
MELKKTTKVFFSLLIILALILTSQQVLSHSLRTETPIAKAGNSTLHIRDEVETHKLFHEVSYTRKRKIIASLEKEIPRKYHTYFPDSYRALL